MTKPKFETTTKILKGIFLAALIAWVLMIGGYYAYKLVAIIMLGLIGLAYIGLARHIKAGKNLRDK